MTTEPRTPPRFWPIVLAVGILAAAVMVAVRLLDANGPAAAEVEPDLTAAAPRSAAEALPAVGGNDSAGSVDADALAGAEPPPEGIHAFPALGTSPPLVGVIVPDDFELPPGFVRHYQSSDDGKSLPAILMYHPTRPPLDERGEPIPVTADRIVPPERVPPGMPVQLLELPKPRPPDSDLQRLLEQR